MVSRSLRPTSVFEHLPMCQAFHPSTKKTTFRMDICPSIGALVLSCPFYPCIHLMCVSAKGLGRLLQLAHAARHGHFLSPSTCRRTASFKSPPSAGASQSAFISITSMSTTFPELEDGICLLRACQAFCQQRWKVDLSARCVMT